MQLSHSERLGERMPSPSPSGSAPGGASGAKKTFRDWQDSLLQHIICNFRMWQHASFAVQLRLFSYLLDFTTIHPRRASHVMPVRLRLLLLLLLV